MSELKDTDASVEFAGVEQALADPDIDTPTVSEEQPTEESEEVPNESVARIVWVLALLPLLIVLAFAKNVATWNPKIVVDFTAFFFALLFVGFAFFTFLGSRVDEDDRDEVFWDMLPSTLNYLAKHCLYKNDCESTSKAYSFLLGRGLAITVPTLTFMAISTSLLYGGQPSHLLTADTSSADLKDGCLTGLGYCSTLSCIVGNVDDRGYTFLILLFVLWVILFNSEMPSFQIDLELKNMPDVLPYREFYYCQLVFRVGISLVLLTGVAPYYSNGTPMALGGIAINQNLHAFGVAGAIFLTTGAVLWYCYRMIHIRAVHRAKSCIPHVLVVWGNLVALLFFIGFVILQARLELDGVKEPSYYNTCYLREYGVNKCDLPPEFNFTKYAAHFDLKEAEETSCEYDSATGLCFEPKCEFNLYSRSYTFEVSGLFLVSIAFQGFVMLMRLDYHFLPSNQAGCYVPEGTPLVRAVGDADDVRASTVPNRGGMGKSR